MQQFYQQHFVRDADASKCETIPALYSLTLYLTQRNREGHIHNKDLSLKKGISTVGNVFNVTIVTAGGGGKVYFTVTVQR